MLNIESVDKDKKDKNRIELLFTDNDSDECIKVYMEVIDARRLARMILDRTKWTKPSL